MPHYAMTRLSQRREVSAEGEILAVFEGPYSDCDEQHQVIVKAADLERYNKGALIQDAFPYLSPDDREFLQTGISPMGWERMWGNHG